MLEGFGKQPLFSLLEIVPSLHVSVWVGEKPVLVLWLKVQSFHF